MTGWQLAALLLAMALLVAPGSPRRRLRAEGAVHRRFAVTARGVGWLCGCVFMLAATVLPVTVAAALAVVGATTGVRYRRRRNARSAMAEGAALEAALEVLVGELRVGAHPVRAFEAAAGETGGAVSVALRGVAARARMGADVPAGLRAAAHTSAMPAHWERIAVCWQLASEHGLAIAGLMRAAQRDITERQRFSAKVGAGLAGARATAVILAGLPVLGVALGQLIGARPLTFLCSAPGGWFLLVGTTLICTGLWWSDRITDRVTPS